MPIYINSGGSKHHNIPNPISLIFYDWDGTTVLGSQLISTTSSPEDIQKAFDTFTATQMPDGVYLTGQADETKNYSPDKDYYNKDYKLTDKDGYSFGKWIDFNSAEPTVYGANVTHRSDFTMETIKEPMGFDITSIPKDVKNIILKAAYKTNVKLNEDSELYKSTTPTDRYYSVTNSSYARFDTGYSYSIKVDVSRVNKDGLAVYRPSKTALRVEMLVYDATGKQQALYTLQEIKDVDFQIAEIIVSSNAVEQVTCTVIDSYGVLSWTGGTTARSLTYKDIVGSGKDGYKYKGTMSYTNEKIAQKLTVQSDVTRRFSSSIFSDLQLSISSVSGATGNVAARAFGAYKNMVAMYDSIISKEGNARPLTWDEMNDAIVNGATYANSGGVN